MNIMMNIKKLSTATVALAVINLVATDTVHAATFTEIGDAGETLSSVQEIPQGPLTLDSISGTVLPSNAPNDADLFRIFIDGFTFFIVSCPVFQTFFLGDAAFIFVMHLCTVLECLRFRCCMAFCRRHADQ